MGRYTADEGGSDIVLGHPVKSKFQLQVAIPIAIPVVRSRREAISPWPSAVAMKPCARLSGLCGLAALVAALAAIISLPATHASEDRGPQLGTCATWRWGCGKDATCNDDDNVVGCICNDNTLTYNYDNETCDDACVGRDCGLEASCIRTGAPSPPCVCNSKGFTYLQADKTCFAPLVRTTVQIKGLLSPLMNVTFSTDGPAEQASGTTVCSNVGQKIYSETDITVVWNASNPAANPISDPNKPALQDAAPGAAMCKSLSFYSGLWCEDDIELTLARSRPVKRGRTTAYPVTTKYIRDVYLVQSVGCEITTCHLDCGAAECVVKDGKQQCQCPDGFIFNAAKKTCRAAPPPSCSLPSPSPPTFGQRQPSAGLPALLMPSARGWEEERQRVSSGKVSNALPSLSTPPSSTSRQRQRSAGLPALLMPSAHGWEERRCASQNFEQEVHIELLHAPFR
ncbi:unnamed protein product [Closterium sp. Yama58-4]|nr:unnamed protein product [Closterium sp. Yama58-4]